MYKSTHRYQRKVKAQMGAPMMVWPSAPPKQPAPAGAPIDRSAQPTEEQLRQKWAARREMVIAQERKAQARITCPECNAPPGEPCIGTHGIHTKRWKRFRSGMAP